MMKKTVFILVMLLMFDIGALRAAVTLEAFTFTTPADEQHFKDLIAEIRCLVCQNQSLLDSDAGLAHDLRAEVYDMMQAGKNDEEIVEFLVTRYGDFVLYKPPLKPSTWLIWFGPFVLLLIAVFLLLRSIRRQQKLPTAEISAAERARLDALLDKPEHTDKEKDA
jgi:cytochrome c-type biogenesis protein CcmH